MFGFGFGFGRGAPPPPAVVASPAFPSTGLVAYWGFDDSLTDSVGSKVLTASGGNSYVTGKLGTKGLQLTATNTAGTSDATVNAVWAGTCSLCIWVKATTILAHNFVGADDFSVQYTALGTLDLLYDLAGGGGTASAPASLSDDTWYHLAVTSDGGTNPPKLYLNGSLHATGDMSAAVDGAATSTAVGYGSNTSTGVWDGFGIWNVELTAQQVANVYNGGSGNSPA